MELHKQLSFLSEIEKLKSIERQNKTLSGRFENSAEHSWHVAMTCVVLGKDLFAQANQLRIIEMLLIHDLVEVYAGDAHLYNDADRLAAVEKEELAARRLFGILPDANRVSLSELREEFESGVSLESKIARALDGFQPLLNHLQTCPAGENFHNLSRSQVLKKKSYIKDVLPELWPYVLEIVDESVARGLYLGE